MQKKDIKKNSTVYDKNGMSYEVQEIIYDKDVPKLLFCRQNILVEAYEDEWEDSIGELKKLCVSDVYIGSKNKIDLDIKKMLYDNETILNKELESIKNELKTAKAKLSDINIEISNNLRNKEKILQDEIKENMSEQQLKLLDMIDNGNIYYVTRYRREIRKLGIEGYIKFEYDEDTGETNACVGVSRLYYDNEMFKTEEEAKDCIYNDYLKQKELGNNTNVFKNFFEKYKEYLKDEQVASYYNNMINQEIEYKEKDIKSYTASLERFNKNIKELQNKLVRINKG